MISKAFQPIKLLIFSVVLLLLLSCSKSKVFDDIQSTGSKGWDASNPLRFSFQIDDTLSSHRFSMHVRNDIDYRYSNLYVFLQTRFPNGNITRDTIECILAGPDGKWHGKASGKYREHLIMLNPGIRFPLPGTYTIDIEQAMRHQLLAGISDIGIRIEKNPH